MPFSLVISLTKFDEIIWFSTSDIKNIVSMFVFSFLFIPANWNSYSKSDTALKPLIIVPALYFLQRVVVKELKEIKNSLLQTFQYIKKDKTVDLRKKYYQIKKFNPKLKSKWYDFSIYNLVLYKHVHSQDIIELAKRYFKSKIIFSARPAIHAHDHTNDYLFWTIWQFVCNTR